MNLNAEILLMWKGVPVKYGINSEGKSRMMECAPDDPEAGQVGLNQVSKKDFDQHRAARKLKKGEGRLIYYRGMLGSQYISGFGASDGQAKKTLFSEALKVTSKRQDHARGAILFTIDIDFHEDKYPPGTVNDAEQVFNWIHGTYFPEAYWARISPLAWADDRRQPSCVAYWPRIRPVHRFLPRDRLLGPHLGMFGAIFQPPVAVWARHGQTDGAVRYRIRDFQRMWKSCRCRGNTVRHRALVWAKDWNHRDCSG